MMRNSFVQIEPPYTPPGKLDFFRIHTHALERLGDLLNSLLPDGAETPGAYCIGQHSDRPIPITVSLLTGA